MICDKKESLCNRLNPKSVKCTTHDGWLPFGQDECHAKKQTCIGDWFQNGRCYWHQGVFPHES